MLHLRHTSQFRRELKRAIKRSKDIQKLDKIVLELRLEKTLPSRNRDHALTGNYKGSRECHIEPDWLLIYRVEGNTLFLESTGTHADLFE